MANVVITGSTRGLGYEMAKCFLRHGSNVIINGRNIEKTENAATRLLSDEGCIGKVNTYACDVSDMQQLEKMWAFAKDKYDTVDIWINNAGVNQPDSYIWELNKKAIDGILDIDLRGCIYGSHVAVNAMKEQGHGAIYNIEGHGSNDAIIRGLSMYGTSKRAVTYFTKALAKEIGESGEDIVIGRLSPGIMITDFITNALGGEETINLPEKTKKIYNILGDYPDIIADFLVNGILKNEIDRKNDIKIEWLTNSKARHRFMMAAFNKRDFFK